MATLIYSALTSLDLYVADEDGGFDWAEPDDEVHQFINDLQRGAGTMLLGRRMYEVLVAWESDDMLRAEQPDAIRDFAGVWRATDKIVFSTSLGAPSSTRTRIERTFDPVAIRGLKSTLDRDLTIGGPELASRAFREGLIDEVQLFLNPIVIGGGNAALPDDVRLKLDLIDERRFRSGIVYLAYRVASADG